ncbi:hypothetical protein [Roseiflexus castenholzii]|uniref:glucosaminidase domain-containing protein n=1 Tax=Roseiflexus castenholzii TaxID=120962 RepID=UPI003C7DA699
MNESEPETPAVRRPPRAVQRTDTPSSARRPNPLARSRDPFDDGAALTIGRRRLVDRRIDVQERLPVAPSFAPWAAEELLAPDDPFDDDARDVLRAELTAAPFAYRPATLRRTVRQRMVPWWLIGICAICIGVLSFFWRDTNASRICFAPGCTAREQAIQAHRIEQALNLTSPAGQHSVLGPPSISAQQIDRILAEWNSPAVGTGATWVELGIRYGIDPAYALAFFIHESGAGTAPGWAGRKPDGSTTHNVGNIICAGYHTCYGRFRDYASWKEGIEDWYRLIAVEYVQWRGAHTVEEIVPIYAPAVENNVPVYVGTVNRLVAEWRSSRAK